MTFNPTVGDHVFVRDGASQETILFLVDELTRSGLPVRTRDLIERLSRSLRVVLVCQCYLKPSHRHRRLNYPSELYSFAAEGYDQAVTALAADLIKRHRPDWALLYGWENSQLVAALDGLEVPIVTFTEYLSKSPTAESQINRSFRHATKILFSQASIPASLTTALWGLEARNYRVLDHIAPAPVEPSRKPWLKGSLQPSPWGDTDLIAKALIQSGQDATRHRTHGVRQARIDAALIETAGGLNSDLAVPRGVAATQAVSLYLRASEHTVPRDRIFAGRLLRRPIEGFNPLIYASDNPDFDEKTGEDPLAHYLRTGRPAGRWSHTVIRPENDRQKDDHKGVPSGFAAAIHAHLHYPELLPEFLERLDANRTKVDLLVTTTSEDQRSEIAATLRLAGIQARSLIVCENRGRDLWPFVSLLQSGAFQAYEVVGHFHSKRSPHFDLGQVWCEFLWTHLVGRPHPMLDIILERFAGEPKLGLVFSEEPHLEGWEKNLNCASDLAERAGIATPLPFHFEYPMGTMFWARPDALAPLHKLGLTLDDIPAEPLAIDGTILHALERLIPFLVDKAGYHYATTHVPGSKR